MMFLSSERSKNRQRQSMVGLKISIYLSLQCINYFLKDNAHIEAHGFVLTESSSEMVGRKLCRIEQDLENH